MNIKNKTSERLKFNQLVKTLLLILAVLFCSLSIADKKKSPSAAEMDKGFYGIMRVASDPKEFINKVQKSTKKGVLELPKSSESVKVGKEAAIFIFFSGCKADKAKKCNSNISFTIYKPNGKVYAKTKKLELWKGKPLGKGKLKLSSAQIGIEVEKKDPKGKYRVEAKLIDVIAKKTITLKQSFEVKK